ncbi:MAG: hypothetical protein V3V01_01925 [Acidimicrobiales bacterium]
MTIILNVIALGLVLAACWAAVAFSTRKSRLVIDKLPPPVTGYFEEPCEACGGVGADRVSRQVQPCMTCEGSGVQPV